MRAARFGVLKGSKLEPLSKRTQSLTAKGSKSSHHRHRFGLAFQLNSRSAMSSRCDHHIVITSHIRSKLASAAYFHCFLHNMQECACSLKLDSLARENSGHVTYEQVSMQQNDASITRFQRWCQAASLELIRALLQEHACK